MAAAPGITVRMAGSSPAKAAQLVSYTNIGKACGVRYRSIGNEPSLYYQEFADWTPARYANEWRAFALAMRAVDDVISMGSTLQGMRLVMDRAGARTAGVAAIFTEGERSQWQDILALGHPPLFLD